LNYLENSHASEMIAKFRATAAELDTWMRTEVRRTGLPLMVHVEPLKRMPLLPS